MSADAWEVRCCHAVGLPWGVWHLRVVLVSAMRIAMRIFFAVLPVGVVDRTDLRTAFSMPTRLCLFVVMFCYGGEKVLVANFLDDSFIFIFLLIVFYVPLSLCRHACRQMTKGMGGVKSRRRVAATKVRMLVFLWLFIYVQMRFMLCTMFLCVHVVSGLFVHLYGLVLVYDSFRFPWIVIGACVVRLCVEVRMWRCRWSGVSAMRTCAVPVYAMRWCLGLT